MELTAYSLVIWMLVFSIASTATLALYGKRFINRVPAAMPFTLLMVFGAGFASVVLLELLSETFENKVLFHNLRFLFLPYVGLIQIWLVLEYVNRKEWIRKFWIAPVVLVSVISTILALTSGYHDFFRYGFEIVTTGPFPVLSYSESVFFHFYSAFNFVLFLLIIIAFLYETNRKGTLFKEQTVLIITASVIPMVVTYLFVVGVTPIPGFNISASLFWLSAILYAIALFRYRFLDIVPVARGQLIRRMRSSMLVLDDKSNVIDANPAAIEVLSLKDVSTKAVNIFDAVGDWPEFLSFCSLTDSSKRDLIKVDEKGTRYFAGILDVISGSDGFQEYRLVILQDVTAERTVDAALQKLQELYMETMDAINEGVWEWDVPNDKLNSSDSLVSILGYDEDDFDGTYESRMRFVHPEDRSNFERELKKIIQNDDDYSFELRVQSKDGQWHWILVRGRVIERDEKGSPIRIIGTETDINAIKKAEDALRVANRKLQLLHQVTRHDILNQIMVIRGYLHLAKEKGEELEIAGYVDKAVKAAEVLEGHVAFTREYENLGVNEPIWFSVKGLAEKVNSHGIRVNRRCDGFQIYCDSMITKVFSNLMDNTLRHGEKANSVTISCAVDGDVLRIIFEDDGVGIPDELKEKVFVRGFGKNTGFGLFLIREILSITNITITENGVHGQGARFEIVVPRDRFRKDDL